MPYDYDYDPFKYGRIHNLPPGVTMNDIDPPEESPSVDCDPMWDEFPEEAWNNDNDE